MSYFKILAALTNSSPSRSRGNLMAAGTLGRQDLFAHDVQPDQARRFPGFKVALHRVGHLLAQLFHSVRFGENCLPERARGEAAFRRFLHHKNQLAHELTISDPTPAGKSHWLRARGSLLQALKKEAA